MTVVIGRDVAHILVDVVVGIAAPANIDMQIGCLLEGQQSLQSGNNIIIEVIVEIIGRDAEEIDSSADEAVDLLGRGNIA